MPRKSLGPRLWFDEGRQNWVIRDGKRFIRTGFAGWRGAQDALMAYMADDPLDRAEARNRQFPDAIGQIYFITAQYPDFPVKIGFTQKPGWMRSRSLQTACPYTIAILGVVTGTFKDEKRLHRRFAAQRLQGEWFQRSEELMADIDEMLTGHQRDSGDETHRNRSAA